MKALVPGRWRILCYEPLYLLACILNQITRHHLWNYDLAFLGKSFSLILTERSH